MTLKPEVIRALEREKRVCEAAINRLRERSHELEQQYGWSTDTFLEKFNAGQIGDDQDFFRWYALAEATKDWQRTRDSLEEILEDPEHAEQVSA